MLATYPADCGGALNAIVLRDADFRSQSPSPQNQLRFALGSNRVQTYSAQALSLALLHLIASLRIRAFLSTFPEI
jgi:hypothetical protein